jgi:cell division protein FtsL
MKRPENLFRAICLCFSVLLLVLSLLWDIRLAALNDLAAGKKRETERLKAENARLLARCESSLSLEEIERYAVEELGMQRLSGEQMIWVGEPVD